MAIFDPPLPPCHPFYYIGLYTSVTFWRTPPPPLGGDVICGWSLTIGRYMCIYSTISFSAIDTELAMYALTLVNKCLYALNDQDTFYDQTDYMEELNMTSIIDR